MPCPFYIGSRNSACWTFVLKMAFSGLFFNQEACRYCYIFVHSHGINSKWQIRIVSLLHSVRDRKWEKRHFNEQGCYCWKVTETEAFESPELHCVGFLFVGLNGNEVCKRKLDARDELLARVWDVAARERKHEGVLRRTSWDLRTRVAYCNDVDGGILEHLFCTVTNLSLLCKKYVIKIKLK